MRLRCGGVTLHRPCSSSSILRDRADLWLDLGQLWHCLHLCQHCVECPDHMRPSLVVVWCSSGGTWHTGVHSGPCPSYDWPVPPHSTLPQLYCLSSLLSCPGISNINTEGDSRDSRDTDTDQERRPDKHQWRNSRLTRRKYSSSARLADCLLFSPSVPPASPAPVHVSSCSEHSTPAWPNPASQPA